MRRERTTWAARLAAVSLAATACMLGSAGTAGARDGKDGRPELRERGSCAGEAVSELRVKSRGGRIELEFEVAGDRAGGPWRVALVRERRVVWKGAAGASRGERSFRVRRRFADLPGAETVSVRAWGPDGTSCRATVTLAGP